jgi:hypothetical protein
VGQRPGQQRSRDHPRRQRHRNRVAMGQPARRTARRGEQDGADRPDDE